MTATGGPGYVQIVSGPCAHCERRIVSLDDGAACPDCRTAVHVDDACWEAHWQAEHAGAPTYRGLTKAPRPVRELPPDRVGGLPDTYGQAGSDALLCTSCHHRVQAPVATSFLGFPRFTCPFCAAVVLHPLRSGRRKLYWGFLVFMGVVSLLILTTGAIPTPGILTIIVIVALSEDSGIRKKLEIATAAGPKYLEPAIEAAPVERRRRRKPKEAALSDSV